MHGPVLWQNVRYHWDPRRLTSLRLINELLIWMHDDGFVFQPDAGSYYTAWSSASSLVAKGLLIRKSHPPKYIEHNNCGVKSYSCHITGFLWVILEHLWPFVCCSRVRGAVVHSQAHQCLLVATLMQSTPHRQLPLASFLEEKDTVLIPLQGHVCLQQRRAAHHLALVGILIHLLGNLRLTALF